MIEPIRHYTDDGISTACAEELVDNLSEGHIILCNPDEDVTCPTCQALMNAVIRLALRHNVTDDGNPTL
jgi:hypothetical protein